MYIFKKKPGKKVKAQSFQFVLPKLGINSTDDPTNSLLEENKLPISRNTIANESIFNQLENKTEVQHHVSDQEWGIQLSSHLRLIADKGSVIQNTKFTKNAIDIINKQKATLLFNTPEGQNNSWKNKISSFFPIIEPTSNWLNTWNTLMALLLLLYFYLLIINLYFTEHDEDQAWYWNQWKNGWTGILNYLYTFVMTIDFIIELHVSYFDKGEYVKNKRKVYINYLQKGFLFDIIPLLVLYFCLMSNQANESTLFRYFYYLKFYRLTVYDERFQERFQLHRKSKAVYLIFKIVIEILILVQLFAALFYRAGVFIYQAKQDDEDYPWGTWLENEMFNTKICDKTLTAKYYLSLYWSLATLTTVSYGDITPVNPLEIFISSVAMLAAIFLFALNVQTIQEVYLEYKASKKKFQKHLIAINRFMRDKQISVSLQSKIRKYLDHIWDKQRAREQKLESAVIDSLAPQLRQELMFESYGMDLIKIPWMSDNFTFDFLKELSEELKEIYLGADEIIFLDKENIEEDHSLYIVKEGEIDLFFNGKAQPMIARLKQGAVFGQYSFITGDGRQCSAKTSTQATLYQVNRRTFINKLQKFEADYERYCQLKDQVMLGRKFDLLSLNCYTCNAQDHMSNECPLTHFTQESQKFVMGSIILKNESKVQGRKRVRRRQKKQKNVIVSSEEFENEENPFMDFEQYCQEKSESCEIDKVHSFRYFFPNQNIDAIYFNQLRNITFQNLKYFTPPLRHQIVPI